MYEVLYRDSKFENWVKINHKFSSEDSAKAHVRLLYELENRNEEFEAQYKVCPK